MLRRAALGLIGMPYGSPVVGLGTEEAAPVAAWPWARDLIRQGEGEFLNCRGRIHYERLDGSGWRGLSRGQISSQCQIHQGLLQDGASGLGSNAGETDLLFC
jgi:hypothetical protein